MYSIRKNGFGDCTQDDSLSFRCEHGELLESCKVDGCAEIWLLYQDAVDEKRREYGLCPWLWWKIDSSLSEPEIFLSQLPYNEFSTRVLTY